LAFPRSSRVIPTSPAVLATAVITCTMSSMWLITLA
jgi:hypothetical protein